jgi:hypothetical protein
MRPALGSGIRQNGAGDHMSGYRPSGSERRAYPRVVVDLPTHIVIRGRAIACRLIDVSRGGALVEAPATVSIGDKVMLQIPGSGDVVATVVRATPISFALAFAGTIILSMAGGGEDADGRSPSSTLQNRNPHRLN